MVLFNMRFLGLWVCAILAICCAQSLVRAQSTVDFGNASSSPGWIDPTLDRAVRWAPSAQLYNPILVPGDPVASNYAGLNLSSLRAVLYYAPSTVTDLSLFLAAEGGPSTFRESNSVTPGSWFGHTATLDGIPLGVTANVAVIVWDSSLSSDPLSLVAQSGLWGHSSIFQFTAPTGQFPLDVVLDGLTSFTVGWNVPEPMSLALGAFGAALLLVPRLRRWLKR